MNLAEAHSILKNKVSGDSEATTALMLLAVAAQTCPFDCNACQDEEH